MLSWRSGGCGAAAGKNATLDKKKSKKQPIWEETGPVPVSAWARFMATCWCRFASWPLKRGIKIPMDGRQEELEVGSLSGTEQSKALLKESGGSPRKRLLGII